MKREPIVALASLLLVSCAGGGAVIDAPGRPSAASSSPARTAAEPVEAVAAAELEVVHVDLADASGPADVVCTKVVRPGTRIVVGEKCAPAAESGVNVQTREEIQREISGQGWSSGWKTADQIAAERRVSLGR
jgi:hypothetical protein